MREILFRGKRVDNGEWVYGDLFNGRSGTNIIENGGRNMDDFNYVIPETVGQYTGLKDFIEGDKAFQGDIVEYKDQANNLQRGIITLYEYFGGYIQCIGGDDEGNQDSELHPDNYFEIVGNIHDNPELL